MKTSVLAALGALALAVSAGTPAAASPASHGLHMDPDTPAVDPALTQVVEEDEPVAPHDTPVEISAGHVDIGPRYVDGTFTLMARDDSRQPSTWRYLDDVVFKVSDTAKMELPKNSSDYDFISADGPVWVVPQNEIEKVVWLGWNTQDPQVAKNLNGGADLVYGGHQGDGDMHVFVQAGNFSGPQELWNSTEKKSQPIHVEANTHTHANWVFTRPGTHLMRLTIQAQLSDGTEVEDTQVLRFAVGDAADSQQALAAQWTQENAPEYPAEINEPSVVDKSASVPLIVGIGLLVLAAALVGGAVVAKSRTRSRKRAAERVAQASEPEARAAEEALRPAENALRTTEQALHNAEGTGRPGEETGLGAEQTAAQPESPAQSPEAGTR